MPKTTPNLPKTPVLGCFLRLIATSSYKQYYKIGENDPKKHPKNTILPDSYISIATLATLATNTLKAFKNKTS